MARPPACFAPDSPSAVTDLDRRLMAAALRLGRSALGRTWPNPAVGTLLVQFDQEGAPIIVGRGITGEGGRPHAEERALDAAGANAKGATAYVSLEPCVRRSRPRVLPCSNRLIEAGVARVLAAVEDPNPHIEGRGFDLLGEHHVAISGAVAEEAGHLAHAGHFKRVKEGRPHVTLKMAISQDGKIGLPGAGQVAITGAAARRRVHAMRASFDAILVGVGTVMADNPMLDCRLPGMEQLSPVRIVFDTYARMPLESAIAQSAFRLPTWVLTAEYGAAQRVETLIGSRIERLIAPITVGAREDRINPKAALQLIGERGITRLLVEGGARLAASLIQAELVDEVVLFRGAVTIGPKGIAALDGLSLEEVLESRFQKVARERIGRDALTMYRRNASHVHRAH